MAGTMDWQTDVAMCDQCDQCPHLGQDGVTPDIRLDHTATDTMDK